MYSNNILKFQESTRIFNAYTKKSGNLLKASHILWTKRKKEIFLWFQKSSANISLIYIFNSVRPFFKIQNISKTNHYKWQKILLNILLEAETDEFKFNKIGSEFFEFLRFIWFT